MEAPVDKEESSGKASVDKEESSVDRAESSGEASVDREESSDRESAEG